MNLSQLFPLLIFCSISFHSFSHSAEMLAKEAVDYQVTNRQYFAKKDLKKVWKKMHMPRIVIPISNEVDVIEMTYTSQWHDGTPVKASGLVFLPKGLKKPAPELVYLHGTKIEKLRRINLLHGEQAICASYAADGYIVFMPDYLGIGQGERFHLYQHAATQSQAAIDMMTAAKKLLRDEYVQTDGRLFITGYSQGGHAAMGLHRDIQLKDLKEFNVVASAPMSGAYDLSGVQSESLFQPYEFPSYLPYLLKSFHEIYQLTEGDFHSIFKSPYDDVVRTHYEGAHAIWDINPLLPEMITDMLNDELVEAFKTDSSFPLRKALRDNDVYEWKPDAPMLICYCQGDEQVTYKNALVAFDYMQKQGASKVQLRNCGKKFNHIQCAVFANIYTKLYFDTIRKGHTDGKKGNAIKRGMVNFSKFIAPGYYKRRYNKEKMPEFMSP